MIKKVLLCAMALSITACSTTQPTQTERHQQIVDNSALKKHAFKETSEYQHQRLDHSVEMFNKIAHNQCGDTGVQSFNQTGKYLYITCEIPIDAPYRVRAKKFTVQIKE